MVDAIARTGSFAAAAREMGKVPSALTYSVRQLEEALDVLLFDRSSRQAKLTAAGKELLQHGRRVLDEVDALANRVRRVATGWEATLTIVVDGVLSRLTLFELVESFYAERVAGDGPGTQLRLRTEVLTGVWEALVTGQADLAIGLSGDTQYKDIEMRPLGEVPFVFVVAPHHPLAAAAEPLGNEEIQRHRAVAVADSAQRLPTATYNLLGGQDVLTVPSVQAKIEAQLRCLGCGYLAEPLVRTHIRDGRLVVKATQRSTPLARMVYGWRADAVGKPRKPPQGLALQWWLRRLESPATRQALLQRHLGSPSDVD